MSDVETGVTTIITELLGVPTERVTADATLADDLGMKALDRAELALEIEADFGLVVFTKPFAELRTVGEVIVYVEETLRTPFPRAEEAA